MEYTKVKLKMEPEALDVFTEALAEIGICGTWVEDPAEFERLLEKQHDYEWDYIDPSVRGEASAQAAVVFYIPETPEGLEQLDGVVNLALEKGLDGMEIGSVSDADWKDQWKDWFRPVDIGGRLRIRPSWEPPADDPAVADIVIDPGMAFGTGNHASTRMCLEYLVEVMPPDIDRVIDLGCGTGILALAAARLGARQVEAVDADPEAIAVARENIAAHAAADRVVVRLGDLLTEPPGRPAELLLGNLCADLIIRWAKTAPAWLQPGGRAILSGVLDGQEAAVTAALADAGFAVQSVKRDTEWVALLAVRETDASAEAAS